MLMTSLCSRDRSELRSRVKVVVVAQGSPSLTVRTVSVDAKHAALNLNSEQGHRAQEMCEGRGGRPGLPVPNSPYGLCGRKACSTELALVEVSLLVLRDIKCHSYS